MKEQEILEMQRLIDEGVRKAQYRLLQRACAAGQSLVVCRNGKILELVPDVEQFPGHIACSAASRSEIVVPLFGPAGEVTAVLDIDSTERGTFDATDRRWLERICSL